MAEARTKHQLRVGLAVKSVLILSLVVLAATAAGGWLYYMVACQVIQEKDRNLAHRLSHGLAMAAAPALASSDKPALGRVVDDLLSQPSVCYACIVDGSGTVIASAHRDDTGWGRAGVSHRPASLAYQRDWGRDYLEVGQPVVAGVTPATEPDSPARTDQLVGGVRLVLDTRQTGKTLAGVQARMGSIAVCVVVCGIPLGFMLVWRVLVLPVRRLVSATAQLAEGDWSARAATAHNDEFGDLGSAFDSMAAKLQAQQQELIAANEQLERKVAQRTGELQQANHRLREEMTEKVDFLRAVSHDLNAPLRNISGMAAMIMIKYRQQLPAEVLARLSRIQANVDAQTALIGELLELSRVHTAPQHFELVDFEQLLSELEATLEYDLKARNIALEIVRPLPTLRVEPSRMRQVFQNLIENAIKYMGDRQDGRIQVGWRCVDGQHRFYVADNGLGVPPAERERIFTVFSRGSSASQSGASGKGVGLALVRSIARRYGGNAWVEPNRPCGSIFYFGIFPPAQPGWHGRGAVCRGHERGAVANMAAGEQPVAMPPVTEA